MSTGKDTPIPDVDIFPVGTPAYMEWHCGRCNTGLVYDSGTRSCEVCGCRYDVDSGAYLGGRGPDVRNDR